MPPPKQKEARRKYQASEKGRAANKRYRQKRSASPEGKAAKRKSFIRTQYGLTAAAYDSMTEAQGGVCALCTKPDPTHPNLSVDHDHETGKVRALLCHKCNAAIGLLNDDPELVQAAADYLKLHRGT